VHRNEIIRQLHQIVDARLFGTAKWPVDSENANRLHTTLLEMGLVEEVPGQANTWRNTPLGNELHIDLLEVFMGLWDEWGDTNNPRTIRPHGETGGSPRVAGSRRWFGLGASVEELCTSGIFCILQPNARTQLTKPNDSKTRTSKRDCGDRRGNQQNRAAHSGTALIGGVRARRTSRRCRRH